jgi:hypothetical protein
MVLVCIKQKGRRRRKDPSSKKQKGSSHIPRLGKAQPPVLE